MLQDPNPDWGAASTPKWPTTPPGETPWHYSLFSRTMVRKQEYWLHGLLINKIALNNVSFISPNQSCCASTEKQCQSTAWTCPSDLQRQSLRVQPRKEHPHFNMVYCAPRRQKSTIKSQKIYHVLQTSFSTVQLAEPLAAPGTVARVSVWSPAQLDLRPLQPSARITQRLFVCV